MAAASETVIAWTPSWWKSKAETRGKVSLVPRPPRSAVDPFAMWEYAASPDLTHTGVIAALFIRFNTLVVRDGINPKVAHAAFLGIDEYRAAIAPDIAGAD